MLWHAIPPHFPPFPPRFSPFFPVFPHFPPFFPISPHFSHFSHFSVAQKRLGDSGVGDFQGLGNSKMVVPLPSLRCLAEGNRIFSKIRSFPKPFYRPGDGMVWVIIWCQYGYLGTHEDPHSGC